MIVQNITNGGRSEYDGTRKTWCKYENGEAVEGYLPNMPTHFMLIPKTPDDFT